MGFPKPKEDVSKLPGHFPRRESLDVKIGRVQVITQGSQTNYVVDVAVKGVKDHFKAGSSVDKGDEAGFDPKEAALSQINTAMERAGFEPWGKRKGSQYFHYERRQ